MIRRPLIAVLALAAGAATATSVPAGGTVTTSTAVKRHMLSKRCATRRHPQRRCAKHTHRPTRHTSTGTSTGPATSTPGSTTTPAALPTRLAVDEREYSLFLSHNPVGAGSVEFNVSNFGGDDHDLHIDTSGPSPQLVASTGVVSPGTSKTINVGLSPGTYTLYCSLADHRALGMQATLTVQ